MSLSHLVREARRNFLKGVGVPKQGTFEVDDFQKDAINSLVEGVDTLVVAPTGSGKTHIALAAMDAVLQMNGRAIYTSPLKALSNTKFVDFKQRFEPKHRVGLLTGDRKIEGDADIVIATTEIFRNELYKISERYSLVVLDEVHFIADAQRGPVWEESIILAPTSATLLMLSASISNAEEIAEWVQEVRKKECRIIIKKERPVELRLGFIHPDWGIIPLYDERGRVFEEVVHFYGDGGLDREGLRIKGGRYGNSGGGPRFRGGGRGGYKGGKRRR